MWFLFKFDMSALNTAVPMSLCRCCFREEDGQRHTNETHKFKMLHYRKEKHGLIIVTTVFKLWKWSVSCVMLSIEEIRMNQQVFVIANTFSL